MQKFEFIQPIRKNPEEYINRSLHPNPKLGIKQKLFN